jgi:beta-fructofuranosidase
MFFKSVLFGASFLISSLAQTSTYVEPTVPTGTPIAGNYTGSLRPQIHYSPPINFMNDPNGMFYLDGTWHLYYQCKIFG